MNIRILETWTGGEFPLSEWLPATSINSSGQASVPMRWVAGPGEFLPISKRTAGGFSRQVVEGPSVNVGVRDAIIDFVVSQIEIDEAGLITVLGVANRAAINPMSALETMGLFDSQTQQVYVKRSLVQVSYEKAYPNALVRDTLDLKALALIEKPQSEASMKLKYGDTPNSSTGLTWREFVAAYSVNVGDTADNKDLAIGTVKQILTNFF